MKVRELDIQTGDILLLRINGITGVAVWLMQAINRDLSRWTHVGVVLDTGYVFEAQPGGATLTPLKKYHGRQGAVVTHRLNGNGWIRWCGAGASHPRWGTPPPARSIRSASSRP